eukprot:snap_masked-scaffold_4-processed-gene-3.16-mRNA-1 protein AED:1.00 eAED:1.00 QI:0/0/0/0/1/1/2/0/60
MFARQSNQEYKYKGEGNLKQSGIHAITVAKEWINFKAEWRRYGRLKCKMGCVTGRYSYFG